MIRPSIAAITAATLLGLAGQVHQAVLAQDLSAVEPERLQLAVGLTDRSSRMIAIGISSLADLEIADFGIDVVWQGPQADDASHLAAEDIQFGLLDLRDAGLASLDDRTDLRAVMRYWVDEASLGSEPSAGDAGYLLVAKSSLRPEVVQELVRTVEADDVVLKAAGVDQDRLSPDESMTDLPLPLHQGVEDYLAAEGVTFAAVEVPAAPADESGQGQTFTLYFRTDEAVLDTEDFQSVAAACQFAATMPQAHFEISGFADTVGPEVYNDDLSRRRAVNVRDAISNDPRFREALSVMEFGERKLAVPTADEVDEPKNRRVEIVVSTN